MAQNPSTRNMFYTTGGGVTTSEKWSIHEDCELCCECHDNRPEGEIGGVRQCVRCKTKFAVKELPHVVSHIKIGGIYNIKILLCLSCQTDLVAAIQSVVVPKEVPKKSEEPDGGDKRSILI